MRVLMPLRLRGDYWPSPATWVLLCLKTMNMIWKMEIFLTDLLVQKLPIKEYAGNTTILDKRGNLGYIGNHHKLHGLTMTFH